MEEKEEIEALKKELFIEPYPKEALKWWDYVEDSFKESPGLTLKLLRELKERGSHFSELYWAYYHSDADNVQYNLDFLDFLKSSYAETLEAKCRTIENVKDDELLQAGELFRSKSTKERE